MPRKLKSRESNGKMPTNQRKRLYNNIALSNFMLDIATILYVLDRGVELHTLACPCCFVIIEEGWCIDEEEQEKEVDKFLGT